MDSGLQPRLREARREAGLTQQALADRVGTKQPNIANYERGRMLPRVDTAFRLAAALGVSVDSLWSLPDDTKKGSRRREPAEPMTTSEATDAVPAA